MIFWKTEENKYHLKIDDDTLLEKVKYVKKRDLVQLATIRGLVLNETSLDYILDSLFKDTHKKKLINLKDELYRNIKKRKYDEIRNEMKKIRRIKSSNLVKKEKISWKELNEVKQLSDLPLKNLIKLAQLRNIEAAGLNRSELFYSLLRTQNHHKEKQYLSLLQANPKNVIIELAMLLNKSDRDSFRKRLK